jgi:hypothetical protein
MASCPQALQCAARPAPPAFARWDEGQQGEDGDATAQAYAYNNPPAAEGDGVNPENLGVLSTFIQYTWQFLSVLRTAFDDDENLRLKCEEFDRLVRPHKAIQDKFCREYHKQMIPYYDACANRNPAPFLNGTIEFLRDLDLKSKYEELTDTTLYTPEEIAQNMNNIWDHVDEMNKYARLYNSIPEPIVHRIEHMCRNIVTQINSGSITFADLDIWQIGHSVLEGATPKDIGQLVENMSTIVKAVGGIEGVEQVAQMGVKTPSVKVFGNVISSIMTHIRGGGGDGDSGSGNAASPEGGAGAGTAASAIIAGAIGNGSGSGRSGPATGAGGAAEQQPPPQPGGSHAQRAAEIGGWRPPGPN